MLSFLKRPTYQTPKIVGHRGARALFTENTLRSIEHALPFVSQVEIDVHLTKDKVLVSTHDPVLGPRYQSSLMTEKRLIKDMTLDEVQSFHFLDQKDKYGFPKHFIENEKIPTLSEVIDLIQSKAPNVELFLEIKYAMTREELALYPERRQILDVVYETLKKFRFEEKTYIMSFDEKILMRIKDETNLKKVFLYQGPKRWPFPTPNFKYAAKKILELEPKVFSPNFHQMIAPIFSSHFKKHIHPAIEKTNSELVPWTVNGIQNWEKCLKLEVNRIITDDPRGLYKYLKRLKNDRQRSSVLPHQKSLAKYL